jgi:large subunit ribosomal protein L13
MGKHKAIFTPFLDTGDHVVVVNAAKVRLTGRKDDNKVYRHFTGYPGGLVETSARRVRASGPPAWWKKPSRACFPRPSSASRCTAS